MRIAMFDFPKTVSSLEEVPEKYRVIYEAAAEDGAGFCLDEGFQKTREDQSDLQQRLAQFEAVAESPEALKNRFDQFEVTENELVIENKAIAALGAAGGNAHLLLPYLKSHLQVAEDGGQKSVQLSAKSPLFDQLASDAGVPDVTDFVTYLKSHPDYSVAFEGPRPQGGGMKPATAGSGPLTLKSNEHSSINAKLEEIAAGTVTVMP
jgi:hypothetical protein